MTYKTCFFLGLSAPLQALGLPNNQLTSVPTLALKSLPQLDRLDLSGNKLQLLDGVSFKVISLKISLNFKLIGINFRDYAISHLST